MSEEKEAECYCDCTNEECGVTRHIMNPDSNCPICSSKVEPSNEY